MFSAAPPVVAGRCDSRTLIVGCGNALRGDDGAGPACVRLLAAAGLPPGVATVDAGTSGADVVLRIRQVARVIFIDACRSGRPPGSIVGVSETDLASIDAAGPLDTHEFRWLDAVRLTRALAGEGPPPTVSAWLVEGADFTPGSGLSPPVTAAVERLAAEIRAAFEPADRLTSAIGG